MSATETPIQKKPSFFRRFSRRPKEDVRAPTPEPKNDTQPKPTKFRRRLTETSKGFRSPNVLRRRQTATDHQPLKLQPSQVVIQCFELPVNSPSKYRSHVELPASNPPKYQSYIELPASNPSKHQFSVELPGDSPSKCHSSVELPRRAHPLAIPTYPFSGPSSIRPWDLPLTPSQASSLYLGFEPHDVSDKWFVYSEGPDRSGKLKIHFHRSRTGMKVAQLFVVMDVNGNGSGRIVGIKWNTDKETNYMNEREAKYMIRMICVWTLGVELGEGYSAAS